MQDAIEKQLKQQALTLKEQAAALSVHNQETFEQAGEMARGLKALEKKVVEYFAPLKKTAHEAHKAITNREAEELKPIRDAMAIVRGALTEYANKLEAHRKAEEEKAKKEADKKAEKQRKALLSKAEKAEKQGDIAAAEEYRQQAAEIYAAPAFANTDRPAARLEGGGGVSSVNQTTIDVVDLRAFLGALLSRGIALTMIQVAPGPLNDFVKVNALETFPGLKITKGVGVRVRG